MRFSVNEGDQGGWGPGETKSREDHGDLCSVCVALGRIKILRTYGHKHIGIYIYAYIYVTWFRGMIHGILGT